MNLNITTSTSSTSRNKTRNPPNIQRTPPPPNDVAINHDAIDEGLFSLYEPFNGSAIIINRERQMLFRMILIIALFIICQMFLISAIKQCIMMSLLLFCLFYVRIL